MEATQLKSEFGGLLFLLIIALFVIYAAKRKGFFRFPSPPSYFPISFGSLFGIFATYVGTAFILFPLLFLLAGLVAKGSLTSLKELPKEYQSWIQLISIYLLFGMIALYCLIFRRKDTQLVIWGDEKPKSFKRALHDWGMGVLTWLISYPIVLFVSALAGIIAVFLFGKRGVEQEAVKVIKDALEHPLRLSLLIFAVAVLVPIMEEILFRGFLQTWLRSRMGRGWAILTTALIFAVVHFSYSQGTGNFELIAALFVLSCFLGFIYERQKTLFAPIGLHMAFNAFTVISILLAAKAA